MLPGFQYREGRLWCEEVPADRLAERIGTPLYIYSRAAIDENLARLSRAFAPISPRFCYALKASGNIHLCRLMVSKGAGMDVVSGGELERAWLAGAPMDRVVFAGVGKTEAEILAALDGRHSPLRGRLPDRAPDDRGCVGLFNIESEQELARIAALAERCGVTARACLRVNPDVDAKTHRYTTTGKHENKFGVDIRLARRIFDNARGLRGVRLVGLHLHLGSPISTPAPYVEGVRAALTLIDELAGAGHAVEVLNIGGGYGVDYGGATPEPIEAFGRAICPLLEERVRAGLRVYMEPGRTIIANAGLLLTRVQYVKHGREKRFIICDAGMHTLIRPALYEAYHFVWSASVAPHHAPSSLSPSRPMEGLTPCDVVGPICESSDFLAQDRPLPPVSPGDLVAVFSAGAYGMSMSMNYNDHAKPAEVLVSGGEATIIRARQQAFDLVAPELSTAPVAL